ncbi:ABC transporter multidrug-family ATP-binding protein [Clostridium tetanomorphum DSM 665]|nr:ABC transporter multidrug-family ATP-binding protein [Clostridium tetanomorphum DSM 665]
MCDECGKTILISSHILSEISLLADDIGIIDHGVLLEEESLAKLESKNSRYVHFEVSDTMQASRILESAFKTKNFKVTDGHNILLYDMALPKAAINRAFMQGG